MSSSNNQGKQTELVKQALICRISDLQLKAGEKLPPQAELRQTLGVGNVTITRAFEALELDGVVEIQPRKGVFVKNPTVNGYIGRHIGLVCMRLECYPFGASLLQCLQIQLNDKACQEVPFLRDMNRMYDADSLDYFNGLERNIRQRRIDGLISTVTLDDNARQILRECGIPLVTVIVGRIKGGGIVLDLTGMVESMVTRVLEIGFRRPALIFCGYPITGPMQEAFLKHTAQIDYGMDPTAYCKTIHSEMSDYEIPDQYVASVRDAANDFIAMPERQRPDAVLIPDDIMANEFYNELLRRAPECGNWMPYLVYSRNRQIPFFFPPHLAGDCYEVDIMKMAEMAASLLMKMIQKQVSPETVIKYQPERINNRSER